MSDASITPFEEKITSGSQSKVSKKARLIACKRCRVRKKKCDHRSPICGECRRAGAECVALGSESTPRFAMVPVQYLESLETRVAELEAALRTAQPELAVDHLETAHDEQITYDEHESKDMIVEKPSRRLSAKHFETVPCQYDMISESGLVSSQNLIWLGDYYSCAYFANISSNWPHVYENTWRQWSSSWTESGPVTRQWQGYFVDMVCLYPIYHSCPKKVLY